MSRRFISPTPMRFNPSPYSALLNPAEMEETTPEASSTTDYMNYVPLVGSVVRELTGGGATERETEASLEAKLEIAKDAKRKATSTGSILGFPMPGSKEYYANQIAKLEAQLEAVREQAAEERTTASLYTLGQVGIALLFLAGAAAVGGLAINQLQRARIQQAELRRMQEEG